MKKANRIGRALVAGLMVIMIAGCSSRGGAEDTSGEEVTLSTETSQEEAPEETPVTEEGSPVPDGMYLSEMTGEPIDLALRDQRPIAVMVDNEITALDHFGTAEADVVYEMINSTLNDRVTRLMCLYKDWKEIPQIGSIRSTRPTNILLFPEWNAVLCHDGGPFYVNYYFHEWTPHYSGFSRVQNGKPYEYTEYVLKGDVEARMNNTNVTENYDEYRLSDESHFTFIPWGLEIHLEERFPQEAKKAEVIDLAGAFWHNKSLLEYNAETGTYDYYEYGRLHVDAEDDEPMSFKNLLIQQCDFYQFDDSGYLVYYTEKVEDPLPAYYITNGYMREIFWTKPDPMEHTRYFAYNDKGELEEISINTGKTYIAIVPEDSWEDIEIR
ncbi:MAG: DUF3048 domain-containing protein [Lachnospiraceae bacterium]|nr:DUF3048 domain-containing protein [Lachnospiraceae bacterium]